MSNKTVPMSDEMANLIRKVGDAKSELSEPKAELDRLVNHFVYTYGETYGPFKCEHLGCPETTWSIFTTERMEPRQIILNKAGKALCAGHFPILYEPGTTCMASMVLGG